MVDVVVPPGFLRLRVMSIRFEAEDVRSIELQAPDRAVLPRFDAGAHIDIMLPDGGERSYSLLNAPSDDRRYVIGVKREPESRGGSAFLCGSVRCGDILSVKPPENSFPLVEQAPCSVFIAGGIGVTPILGMLRRLDALGQPWRLFYAARSRASAAFLDEILILAGGVEGRVVLRLGDEGDAGFTMASVLEDLPDGAHLYCCGPSRMLHAFEEATAALPPERVHREYFSADKPVAEGGFEVVLAKSGRSVKIPHDQTILEALLAEGMNLPRSCMEGVCGTCEAVVLEGTPDHRDNVLSAREKRLNKKIIICRSGCIGERLVLDL